MYLSKTEKNLGKYIVNEDFVKQTDLFRKSGFMYDDKGEPVLDANGEQERVSFLDFVTETDIKPLLKRVISTILVEGIQPNLMVINNLFTYLPIGDGSEVVELKSIEEIQVGYVAKGGDFPTSSLSFDNIGSTIAAKVNKVGAQLIIDADVIRKNQFAIVSLWLREAGKALAKFKENVGINVINEMGTVVYDNADPTNSALGVTTPAPSSRIGTILLCPFFAREGNAVIDLPPSERVAPLTITDFQQLYIYLTLRGFRPDTLLVNPLAWQVLALDPLMREIVLKNAVVAPNVFPMGNPAGGFVDPHSGRGYRTYATGTAEGSSADTMGLTPVGASFYLPASTYLPTPVKVLVSHLVPYSEISEGSGKYKTNIIMADSSQCGVLYQEGDTVTNEGFEYKNDTYFVNIYEKYGTGIWAQGKGIALAKNIAVEQNYVFENANSQKLTEIDKNTAIIQ